MKAIEQPFHIVLFILLYKVVLTFESVDKTESCDDSNESYWAVLFTKLRKMVVSFTTAD